MSVTPQYPSFNDRDYDLLKKIVNNTASIADDGGVFLTVAEGDARYLQLTGGTLSGNLTVNAVLSVLGTTFTETVGNNITMQALPGEDVIFRLGSTGDTFKFMNGLGESRISVRGWGNTSGARNTLSLYTSRGTEASPLPTNNGDYLGNIYFGGQVNTAVASTFKNQALIRAYAKEAPTATQFGAALVFSTVKVGTSTMYNWMMLDNDGRLYLGENANSAESAYFAGNSTNGLTIATQGTNQDITLTPSGTGVVVMTKTAQNVEFQVKAITSGTASQSLQGYSSSTTTGAGAFIVLQNQDTTANNQTFISTIDSAFSNVARLTFRIEDHTNHVGSIGFSTRASGGALTEQMRLLNGGALAFPNTNTAGIQLYNTADQTTNYERMRGYWTGNTFYWTSEAAGSGTARGAAFAATAVGGFNNALILSPAQGAASQFRFTHSGGQLNGTSGTGAYVSILPTYNQTSGTAANTDLLINRTQTAVGSGAQLLIDAQVGGVSKFSVTNTGVIAIGNTVAVAAAIASTHKVTISIGGTTYYLLASNV